MTILVTGGTGFVGPKVIEALRRDGRDVRALVRHPERAQALTAAGVELVRGDMTDAASLEAAVKGCAQVVHLVAVIKGSPSAFDRVMAQGTRDLVTAARSAGVERFVLMSALGTDERSKDTIPYYAAKWSMEQEVAGSGLQHTIFRPSFVFGRGGGALEVFLRQVRYSPLVPVIGPGLQRSQPIWIDDVAAYLSGAIDHPLAANRLFEIGGPDIVTWNELYLRIAAVLGKRRKLVHVPFGAARIGARLTERLPGAPLTADQVSMLEGADNVVSNTEAADVFRLPLVPLDEQIRRAA